MKHWQSALLTTSMAPKKKTDTQKEGKFVLGYKQNWWRHLSSKKGSRQENNEGIELIILRKGQKHFEGEMMDVQWPMNAVRE